MTTHLRKDDKMLTPESLAGRTALTDDRINLPSTTPADVMSLWGEVSAAAYDVAEKGSSMFVMSMPDTKTKAAQAVSQILAAYGFFSKVDKFDKDGTVSLVVDWSSSIKASR